MLTQTSRKCLALTMLLPLLAGCTGDDAGPVSGAEELSVAEAQSLARDAYVYGFPMVVNYKTLYNYAVDEISSDYKGPFNEVSCEARLFTADDKAVVTPNSDTPYCMFWMDLRAEPMVLTVPEMEAERFYHAQFIDLYTHNIGYVGTITTGNGAGRYLIAGPGWEGEKPEGIDGVFRSETRFLFAIIRTQLYDPDDMARVEEIQAGYGMQPLSAFVGQERRPASPLPNFPTWVEGSQFDERALDYIDFVMSLLEEPGAGEEVLWERLADLGLGPAGTFDFGRLPADLQAAVQAGVAEGFKYIEEFVAEQSSDPLSSAKVFGTREFLTQSARENFGHENHHLARAAAAHIGLFGNSGAEAIYIAYFVDSDGQPLNASVDRYTMTFEGGELPPVQSFWSLTMYDGATQLFIHNPLDRYLLNSPMLDQFKFEGDGSLILHLSKESPGIDLEPNWLPAPDGPFYTILRLYGPKAEVLGGYWPVPGLMKVE